MSVLAMTQELLERVERCPVCASERRTELFECHDWIYRVPGEFITCCCNDCGLRYLVQRPTAAALGRYYPEDAYYSYHAAQPHRLFARRDLAARIWYALRKSVLANDYGYRHLGGNKLLALLARPLRSTAAYHLQWLLHPFVEDGSLLEVGCGSGDYLDLMRALGWQRVVGIDISERAVQQAREVLGLEAYCAQLSDAPLPDNTFDAVSLSHTLEHVADPVGFLKELHRLMKPGARLAILVPNAASRAAAKFGTYCISVDAPRHLINFTPDSLARALRESGFAVEGLATPARGSYQVALFSHSRQAGDPHEFYFDDQHRFPFSRRLRAAAFAMVARVQCALGQRVGEGLHALARKPGLAS